MLVGTQMIAKGHHFPEVTLVGVVNADLELRFPDFRAEERTFAMLVQVGGRSGRGERPGRVLVQTLDPQARGRSRVPAPARASSSTPRSSRAGACSAIRRRRRWSRSSCRRIDPDKATKGARFVADKLLAALSGRRGRSGSRPALRASAVATPLVSWLRALSIGKTIDDGEAP